VILSIMKQVCQQDENPLSQGSRPYKSYMYAGQSQKNKRILLHSACNPEGAACLRECHALTREDLQCFLEP